MQLDVVLYIVGMGGTGTFLLAPLSKFIFFSKLNQFRLKRTFLVDGDSYSGSNLERQFFPPSCVGMNKATAQGLVLKSLKSGYPESGQSTIEVVPHFLTSANIHEILGSHEDSLIPVVIVAVDNHDCRRLIAEYFDSWTRDQKEYVLINGGNGTTDGNASIQGILNQRFLGAPLLQRHPEILTDKRGTREGVSCMDLASVEGGEQTMIANICSALSMYSLLYEVSQTPRKWASGESSWVDSLKDIYFEIGPMTMRSVMGEDGKEEDDADRAVVHLGD